MSPYVPGNPGVMCPHCGCTGIQGYDDPNKTCPDCHKSIFIKVHNEMKPELDLRYCCYCNAQQLFECKPSGEIKCIQCHRDWKNFATVNMTVAPGNTTPDPAGANSLDAYFAAVRDSVEGHARRKNYTDGGADGDNKMLNVMRELGIDVPHAIGEIIYKCAEYLKTPRRVLLEKVAGWAFVVWREHVDTKEPNKES